MLSLHPTSTNDQDLGRKDARAKLKIVNDAAEMVDRVVPILAAAEGIFQRHGLLVRVSHVMAPGDSGARTVQIEPLKRSALAEVVARRVQVLKSKTVSGTIEWEPAVLPAWVSRTIIERGEWPDVAELKTVAYAPHLLPDGRVLEAAGFHAEDSVLLDFSEQFPPLPAEPSRDDAVRAAHRLLAWANDFPFVAACDRTALLAAILTVVARWAIPGPALMFVIRATTPGSGKTLLGQVLSVLGTGRMTSPVVFGTDEPSTRKAILSIGMGGAGVVLLDNVEGSIGSPSLAAALTSRNFTDRLLGVSRMVTVDLGGVTWIATGNNLRLRGDLGRRVVPIDLDAAMEHPEDRAEFAIDDLLDHVRRNRGQFVIDALTVLRAYHLAGRPRHGGPRIGSFEAWDDLVRGAVVWVGIGDPTEGRERLRQDGDSDLDALRMLIHAWESAFSAPVTVAEVVRHLEAGESRTLRDAIAGIVPDGQIASRALAYALRRHRGRVVDGRRLVHATTRASGGNRWLVERLSQAAGADDADHATAADPSTAPASRPMGNE